MSLNSTLAEQQLAKHPSGYSVYQQEVTTWNRRKTTPLRQMEKSMSINPPTQKRESKDERADRIANEIMSQERLHREQKTARLRARRIALSETSR